MRIKVADARQARENMQRRVQDDIQQAHLVHADSSLPAQEGLQNFSATVSKNDDVLESLGKVLGKITAIANATADAVGAIAQASGQFQHSNRLII